MTTILKWAGLVALVLVIVVGIRMFFPQTKVIFGAAGNMLAENYDPSIRYNGGFNTNLPMVLGGLLNVNAGSLFSTTGTQVNRVNFGTCQIQASANTIAASTTATADCVLAAGTPPGTALTGITAGDIVSVTPSTTTPTTYEGLQVHGASASSTPGYITVNLFNGTGATFTWTSAASTSLQYQVMH